MNSKKSLFFIILEILSVFLIFSQDYSFFKHSSTVNIDYKTGDTIFAAYDPFHLEDVKIVKKLNIEVKKSNNNSQITKRSYSDGKIIHQYNKVYEITDTEFCYNDLGFLIKGINQTREYIKKNECIVYKNDKPEKKITLSEENNHNSILVEKYYPDGNFYISNRYDYFYENSKLAKVILENYNKKGQKQSSWIASYKYKNSFLEKQIITIKDEIRWEFDYFYDSTNKICEIHSLDLLNPSQNKKILFSEYDSNGNWHFAEEYYGDISYCEILREIDYQ